ncbi:MAG: UDP-2,3-diacylglucosamine diphosphatase [Candidatus Rifleibacteriota bacterium]
MSAEYEAVFISDLHLGNDFVNIDLLQKFLTVIKPETETLYLVGDIFDTWRNCDPQKFLYLFEGFRKIVYLKGNHDGRFAGIDNPFPENAIISERLEWQNFSGIVTHAHLFDPHFHKSSWWAKLLDSIIYMVSRIIGVDIKNNLGRIGKNYSDEIEKSASMSAKVFKADFMIIGHTHYGGERRLNGVRLFNLGSWITKPFALFRKGNQFSFIEVSNKKLIPGEVEYSQFHTSLK